MEKTYKTYEEIEELFEEHNEINAMLNGEIDERAYCKFLGAHEVLKGYIHFNSVREYFEFAIKYKVVNESAYQALIAWNVYNAYFDEELMCEEQSIKDFAYESIEYGRLSEGDALDVVVDFKQNVASVVCDWHMFNCDVNNAFTENEYGETLTDYIIFHIKEFSGEELDEIIENCVIDVDSVANALMDKNALSFIDVVKVVGSRIDELDAETREKWYDAIADEVEDGEFLVGEYVKNEYISLAYSGDGDVDTELLDASGVNYNIYTNAIANDVVYNEGSCIYPNDVKYIEVKDCYGYGMDVYYATCYNIYNAVKRQYGEFNFVYELYYDGCNWVVEDVRDVNAECVNIDKPTNIDELLEQSYKAFEDRIKGMKDFDQFACEVIDGKVNVKSLEAYLNAHNIDLEIAKDEKGDYILDDLYEGYRCVVGEEEDEEEEEIA